MSITAITQNRSGGGVTIGVTSSLAAPVYFFWYLDGAFAGMSATGSKTFILAPGDQSAVDVLDSVDPDFDNILNAPANYPARRTLVFVRSLGADVSRYRIEEQKNGGAWSVIGYVRHLNSAWSYTFVTGRLLDLTQYAWRAVPLDSAGNDGTPATLAQELIVRTPDAPNFTASLQFVGGGGGPRVGFSSV